MKKFRRYFVFIVPVLLFSFAGTPFSFIFSDSGSDYQNIFLTPFEEEETETTQKAESEEKLRTKLSSNDGDPEVTFIAGQANFLRVIYLSANVQQWIFCTTRCALRYYLLFHSLKLDC